MKHKIPKKGFEAWFYKKFPGNIKNKRMFLILVAVALYATSFVFLIKADVINAFDRESKNFAEKISNIKLR